MKTPFFLFVLLSALLFGFTSCDKSDTAIEDLQMNEMTTTDLLSTTSAANTGSSALAAFQPFGMNSALSVSKSAANLVNDSKLGGGSGYTRVLRLEGKGEATSELLNTAFVRFEMMFNKSTYDFDGTLTYNFQEEGDQLVVRLYGSGPFQTIPQYNGPHNGLIGSIEFVSGTGRFEDAQVKALGYMLNASQIMSNSSTYIENINLDGYIEMPNEN